MHLSMELPAEAGDAARAPPLQRINQLLAASLQVRQTLEVKPLTLRYKPSNPKICHSSLCGCYGLFSLRLWPKGC